MASRIAQRCLYGAFLCCLLIQGCLPSQHSRQSPMFAMSDVTNDLGVCALQLLANSMPGQNIAFSPYGLASVSMLLYEGASGHSAHQLREALQLPYDGLYARVGFRDLYRHLRSYFMSDGFLKGLVLSRENICIRAEYMRVLAFYGFDLPEHTSVEPCNGTASSTLRPSTSSTKPSSTITFSTNPSLPTSSTNPSPTSSTNPSPPTSSTNPPPPTSSTNLSPSTSSTIASGATNPSSALTDSTSPSSTTSATSSANPSSTDPSSAFTSGTGIPLSGVISSSTDPATNPSSTDPSNEILSTSLSFTTSEEPTSTTSSALENKETLGFTESISETSPLMTTLNSVTSTSATSQGTEPTILEQLTTITTEPTEVKTTTVTSETTGPTDLPSIETTMSLINLEMTTNLNAEFFVTTAPPNNNESPTNPPITTNRPSVTTVIDEQPSSVELTTSGAMENEVSTLSNKIGSGENTGSVTTPVSSVDKVDTTLTTNENGGDTETTLTMNIIDLTTVAPNVETTTLLNNVDSGNVMTTLVTSMNVVEATTPGDITEVVTTMNNVETSTVTVQQNIGTTGIIPLETTATMMEVVGVNNNEEVTTTIDPASATTVSPMTSPNNMEQVTNLMEPTQTTPSINNDKLSTIVEVTTLLPSTMNPQVMGEQDGSVTQTESASDSNTTPYSANDKLSTILEENLSTTMDPNETNAIVFNTTPSNKNDKLSTIVEVTVPPPSTFSTVTEPPENTESTTNKIPETNTTEIIDTTIPTTLSSVESTTTGQVTTSEPSITTEIVDTSNDKTAPDDTPIVTTVASLKISDSEVNKNSSKSIEVLEPASSVNTLVQRNETFFGSQNPNDQVQIINNIVEDSLAAYVPPEKGAYIDKAKPNKASIVLNYDYLNPENFQDYVNVVEKNTNANDNYESDPDFMDAIIQDAVRRNKSLVSHFMDNNQVRYSYETYAHNLKMRDSRSIAYETPLLHKIKSWIKYKSGYNHIDPFSIAHIIPSFEPPLADFVPTFASKSADYPLPSGSYSQPSGSYSQPSGSYLQTGGSYLPTSGSYSEPDQNYIPTSGNHAQSGGSYSQHRQKYTPNVGNHAQHSQSYSPNGGSYTQSSGSYLTSVGNHAQTSQTYVQNGGSYSPASGSYSGGTYSPSTGGSYSPSASYQSPAGNYLPSGTHQSGGSHQSTGGFHQSTGGSHQSTGSSHQSVGGAGYHSVTPSYEPPYASYVNRMPEDLDWFLANGRARIVPVMRYTAVLPYAYVAQLDAFALEIPLDDDKYKLLILLPSSSYGLTSLLKALPYCSIRAIYSQLSYVSVYATLPVFDVVEQISLMPTLHQMGVSDIFDISKADLSTMSSDSNLFVRDIMQVVAIYAKKYNSELVHEVPAHSTQTTFTASHSFVYFVVDNFTKVSLLAGVVEDPTTRH